jgi:hypothetical protein
MSDQGGLGHAAPVVKQQSKLNLSHATTATTTHVSIALGIAETRPVVVTTMATRKRMLARIPRIAGEKIRVAKIGAKISVFLSYPTAKTRMPERVKERRNACSKNEGRSPPQWWYL